MAGIVSYGAYIPRYRIDRKTIFQAMGWLDPSTFVPGEKAVANYDEDSITMAVAAGFDCLQDFDRSKIDAAFFASTTFPYKERLNAQILSTAFNLRSDIRSIDFSGTVKSGTTAILSALDSVKAREAKNVIVSASDFRTGKAGSSQEEIFGDGAASLILGDNDVIADFIGSYSISHDFMDHWRADEDQFDRQWEDRFIRDVGYKNFIMESITGVLNKTNINIQDIAKVGYPCLYPADHKNIAKKLGLSAEQVQDPLLTNLGYTGTSNPLILLVAALEDAAPGDKILIASFGQGSDALLFEAAGRIGELKGKKRAVKKNLEAKRPLESYEKMASFRNLLTVEKGIRGEEMPFTAVSEMWRSRDQIIGLCGTQCKKCNTPQYPAHKVCVNPDCGEIGQMEPYRFSDKKAKLVMYTGDSLAYSPNPPAIYGTVDFDGGGRFWFDMTDADLEDVQVGMPVEMHFRKKYQDDKMGIHGYFWKIAPTLD